MKRSKKHVIQTKKRSYRVYKGEDAALIKPSYKMTKKDALSFVSNIDIISDEAQKRTGRTKVIIVYPLIR